MAKLKMSRIPAASIELGRLPFNLYYGTPGRNLSLFCRQGMAITVDHIKMLRRSGRVFYIANAQLVAYLDYASERVENIARSDAIHPESRVRLLRGIGTRVAQRAIERPTSTVVMNRVGRLVYAFVNVLMNFPDVRDEAFSLTERTDYLAAHSFNVCTFCLLIGYRLHGEDRLELWRLAMGGLLHDVGMARIPGSILNKPGSLTRDEWNQVRAHTEYGYEILLDHDLPVHVPDMARGHHERADGSGYPNRLRLGGMPEHVRIAAVADVYDALTSDRPYHRRRGVIDALAEMAAGAQGFDVAAFNALLDITLKDRRVVRNFCKTRMNPKIATRLLANR